jgi:hypothetical protein
LAEKLRAATPLHWQHRYKSHVTLIKHYTIKFPHTSLKVNPSMERKT